MPQPSSPTQPFTCVACASTTVPMDDVHVVNPTDPQTCVCLACYRAKTGQPSLTPDSSPILALVAALLGADVTPGAPPADAPTPEG